MCDVVLDKQLSSSILEELSWVIPGNVTVSKITRCEKLECAIDAGDIIILCDDGDSKDPLAVIPMEIRRFGCVAQVETLLQWSGERSIKRFPAGLLSFSRPKIELERREENVLQCFNPLPESKG